MYSNEKDAHGQKIMEINAARKINTHTHTEVCNHNESPHKTSEKNQFQNTAEEINNWLN